MRALHGASRNTGVLRSQSWQLLIGWRILWKGVKAPRAALTALPAAIIVALVARHEPIMSKCLLLLDEEVADEV